MTPQERQALMQVRDKLRSGEIPADQFDMCEPCGSPGCIGMWMLAEMGEWRGLSLPRFRDAAELFFPGDEDPYSATPHQAAQAIDNFLEDGDPKWREVMSAGEGE